MSERIGASDLVLKRVRDEFQEKDLWIIFKSYATPILMLDDFDMNSLIAAVQLERIKAEGQVKG